MNNFAKCVKKKHISEASHTSVVFHTGNRFLLDKLRKRHKFIQIYYNYLNHVCKNILTAAISFSI